MGPRRGPASLLGRASGTAPPLPLDQASKESLGRTWVTDGAGILTVDSPRMLFLLLETFGMLGLHGLATRVSRRASRALGQQVHAASSPGRHQCRLAPRRRLPRTRHSRAQRLVVALALRSRRAQSRHPAAPTRRHRRDRHPRFVLRLGSRSRARGGAGSRDSHRPADVRSRRRAVVRRHAPAPNRHGPLDVACAIRHRDVVLRALALSGGSCSAGLVGAARRDGPRPCTSVEPCTKPSRC